VAIKKKAVKSKPAAKKSAKAKPAAKKTKIKKPVKKAVVKKAVAKKTVKKVARKAVVKKAVKKIAKKPVVKKVVKPAAKKVVVKKTTVKPVSNEVLGFPEKLRDAALQVLDDRKAEDLVMIDLRGKSAIADYMILATGRSARQAAAMADYLREAFEKMGVKNVKIEGLPQGDWVLVDTGDIIVHLFRPEVRSYYAIDELWAPKRATRRK